jgi:cyclopropane fatty-acyl-phospholipid synthase-like methyltransferase
MYEWPTDFWLRVLGEGLGFHLGHFPAAEVSLSESMALAVLDLANMKASSRPRSVLDVGCGWGQPAFELSSLWDAPVHGLTISARQAEYVNQTALIRGLQVNARVADVEHMNFSNLGTFDAVVLYEVLEHIVDRRALFEGLCRVSRPETALLIAVSCDCTGEGIWSELQGVQPLDSVSEVHEHLCRTGWKVVKSVDCTALTIPVWRFWLQNLNGICDPCWSAPANRLVEEFQELEKMFRLGRLASFQMIAHRN